MRIELTGRFKPNMLMDELLDAFPAWRGTLAPPEAGLPPGALENPKIALQSKPIGDGSQRLVMIDVPDDADRATVDAIIAAHDAAKESRGERATRERRDALAVVQAEAARNPTFAALLKVLRVRD